MRLTVMRLENVRKEVVIVHRRHGVRSDPHRQLDRLKR
jgi:hypothetical protein